MAEKIINTKTDASLVPPAVRAKPVKPAKSAAAKNKPAPKKAGCAVGFLGGLLFSLLTAAILGGLIWFNIAGLRTAFVTTLKLNETEYAYLQTRQSALAQAEAELAEKSRQLAADQNSVQSQQQKLTQGQADLATRESELAAQAAEISGQKTDLDAIVSLYETMDPGKAAQILVAANQLDQQIPALKRMNKTSLAAILAEMNPQQASQVVALIAGGLTANPS